MNRGQEIRLENVSSPMEIKLLNDTLNYILTVLGQRFDLNERYKTVFNSSSFFIQAGETKEFTFRQVFTDDPQVIASAENGAAVKISIASGETDKKKKVGISFTDPTESGTVNIIAAGKAGL